MLITDAHVNNWSTASALLCASHRGDPEALKQS